MSDAFLSQDDVAILTGIRKGRNGSKREELQISQLRKMGLPFFINARGAPIVAKAAVTGDDLPEKAAVAWQPAVLNKAK